MYDRMALELEQYVQRCVIESNRNNDIKWLQFIEKFYVSIMIMVKFMTRLTSLETKI